MILGPYDIPKFKDCSWSLRQNRHRSILLDASFFAYLLCIGTRPLNVVWGQRQNSIVSFIWIIPAVVAQASYSTITHVTMLQRPCDGLVIHLNYWFVWQTEATDGMLGSRKLLSSTSLSCMLQIIFPRANQTSKFRSPRSLHNDGIEVSVAFTWNVRSPRTIELEWPQKLLSSQRRSVP